MLLFTLSYHPVTDKTRDLPRMTPASVQQHIVLVNALVLLHALLKGKVTNGFDQDEGQNCPTPCSNKILLCAKPSSLTHFPG